MPAMEPHSGARPCKRSALRERAQSPYLVGALCTFLLPLLFLRLGGGPLLGLPLLGAFGLAGLCRTPHASRGT